MPFRTTRPRRQPKLGLEVLESREVPAVLTLYDEYLEPASTAQAVSSPALDGTGPRFEPQRQSTNAVPGEALTRNAEARIDRDVRPNGVVRVSALASVNPDYDKIFAFSTAGVNLRLIYRIDPGEGESVGDPVNITLVLTGSATPKNTSPDVGAAYLTGSAAGDSVGDFVRPGAPVDSTWVLKGEKIGSFVTLVIGARGQAVQGEGLPLIRDAGATLQADLTIQPLSRDVSPTSLAWEAVKGGVNLSYTNSEALPAPPAGQRWTYNLFWADRTGKKISEGLLGAGLAMDRGKGPHSEYVISIGAPPPDATQLLYEVNSGGLAGENRSNNTRLIAYAPAVNSFTAKYDGTGTADTVIGRFFSGSDPKLRFNPIDQTYSAVLSDSLAAIKPQVTVSIGGQPFVATRQADGVTYRTEPIDPGQFVGDKIIEVKATIGGASQGETWKGTLDTEPLPEWVSKLGEGKTLAWARSASGGLEYQIEGRLLDVNTPALLDIPDGVWLGGAEDLKSKVVAKLGVKVAADIDPKKSPDVSGTLDVAAELLGKTITKLKQYHSPSNDPFALTFKLDGQTLELTEATATYTLPGPVVLEPVNFDFGNKFLTTTWYQAQSKIVFTPSLQRLVLSATFGTDGKMTAGSIDVGMKGVLAGDLLNAGINNKYLLRTLQAAARLFGTAPLPSALGSYLVEFLQYVGVVPTFKMSLRANGELAFGAKIDLMNPQKSTVEKATMSLAVSGRVLMTWLGKTDEIARIDEILNQQFGIEIK